MDKFVKGHPGINIKHLYEQYYFIEINEFQIINNIYISNSA